MLSMTELCSFDTGMAGADFGTFEWHGQVVAASSQRVGNTTLLLT